MLTFSGTARAEACPPSEILPHVATLGNEASSYGTVVHAYLEDVRNLGRDPALARAPPEHRAAMEAINLQDLPVNPDQYLAEAAFSYDWTNDSARYLGSGMARNYSAVDPAREIPGTLDTVGLLPDAVIVLDYKTGWQRLPPAKQSWQLRLGALSAARHYARRRAIVGYIRINEAGEPYWDRAELDEFDLDATAVAIADLIARVADTRNLPRDEWPFTTGPHCQYCPATPFCPVRGALLHAAGSGGPLLPQQLMSNEMTPAMMVDVWNRLGLATQTINKAWEDFKAVARVVPFTLPDGRIYGPRQKKTEVIDPAKGSTILAEAFSVQVALDALNLKKEITKKRLSQALAAYAKGKENLKITRLKVSALELLREGGAMRLTTKETVDAHKPNDEGDEDGE